MSFDVVHFLLEANFVVCVLDAQMSLPRNSLILCSRCIRLEVLRRASSTASPQKRSPLLSKFGTWFRFMFGEAKQLAFTKEIVVLRHNQDKLSPKEWILIYNDLMHARFRFLMCFLLPSALFIGTYALQDYNKNGGKFSHKQLQILRRNLYDAGYYKYAILFLMSCSASMLIRNLQLRVYRIYQNIQDPFKFYVFRSRSLIFSEWVIVPRSAIKPNDVFYDFAERAESMGRGRRFLRQLFHGRAKIDGRRALIEDIFFRSNNLRTFMLHETSAVPKQIVDIQKKLLDEGKTKR